MLHTKEPNLKKVSTKLKLDQEPYSNIKCKCISLGPQLPPHLGGASMAPMDARE